MLSHKTVPGPAHPKHIHILKHGLHFPNNQTENQEQAKIFKKYPKQQAQESFLDQ